MTLPELADVLRPDAPLPRGARRGESKGRSQRRGAERSESLVAGDDGGKRGSPHEPEGEEVGRRLSVVAEVRLDIDTLPQLGLAQLVAVLEVDRVGTHAPVVPVIAVGQVEHVPAQVIDRAGENVLAIPTGGAVF